MIETDEQRRWWFATHPEYSWSRTGAKNRGKPKEQKDPNKLSPEEVDAYVDHALKHVHGTVADLLKAVKRHFGTEGEKRQSHGETRSERSGKRRTSSDSKDLRSGTMFAGPVITPDDYLDVWRVRGGGGGGGLSRPPVSPIPGGGRGGGRSGPPPKPPAPPTRPPGGADRGPGEWVEVGRRGGPSLEHQSRMSGQPIRESGGHHFIKEYKIGNTHFDDYRDGKLYEYKGRHEHLFDKSNEIKPYVEKPDQFREEALRQVKAAKGIPVIWRVGAHQVEAFKKAVGRIPGITIEP